MDAAPGIAARKALVPPGGRQRHHRSGVPGEVVDAREARRAAVEGRGPRWAAAGALAALCAVFAAGLFEYNLGDSEVLMLVLLLTAVPFATRDEPAPA